MQFSGERLLPDQVRFDLPATARVIKTAFFVIQGAEDRITPTQAARDYFDRVEAPVKSWTAIPNAGHFAWMTSSDAFLRILNERVRPLAVSRGA